MRGSSSSGARNADGVAAMQGVRDEFERRRDDTGRSLVTSEGGASSIVGNTIVKGNAMSGVEARWHGRITLSLGPNRCEPTIVDNAMENIRATDGGIVTGPSPL